MQMEQLNCFAFLIKRPVAFVLKPEDFVAANTQNLTPDKLDIGGIPVTINHEVEKSIAIFKDGSTINVTL